MYLLNRSRISNVDQVSGRLALIVGSQCARLNQLSFLPAVAEELAAVLAAPGPGNCEPALGDGTALLLDPTTDELDRAVEQAFRVASQRAATLILAFVGHGVTDDDDFYLMAHDSPDRPNSRQAFLFGQRIKELLRTYSGLDGLVLLVDTCESGRAADQAAREWIPLLRRSGRRFEVLTATGDGPAAAGCFTRQLIYLIKTGSARSVDRLGCRHLQEPINALCPTQVATHTAHDGGADIAGDDSLYLAINVSLAWRRSPVAGTAVAGLVSELAGCYQPTAALRDVRALLAAGAHLVWVTGGVGTGKSALVAALAQPALAGHAASLLHGAVFTGPDDSVERAAAALGDQLARTTGGFADAVDRFRQRTPAQQWQRADVVERLVAGPLRDLGRPVRIALDGVRPDHPLVVALAVIEDVTLVATSREQVDHEPQIRLRAASDEDIAGYGVRRGLSADAAKALAQRAGGNWTVAKLLADQLTTTEPADTVPVDLAGAYDAALARAHGDDVIGATELAAVLAVLAAAGSGPVLPLPLLLAAGSRLGGPRSVQRLRDVLARLSALVTRGEPGDDGERVGLLHPTVAAHVWDRAIGGIGSVQAHAALAGGIDELAPAARHRADHPLHAYAALAEPEHLWRCARFEEALDRIERRPSLIQAENERTWANWSRRVDRELGVDHPLALRARSRHATAIAEAGDPTAALTALDRLLHDTIAALGAEHRETLIVRDNIAYWRGHHDSAAGLTLFSSLAEDCARLLGEWDPQTLTATHHKALMLAKNRRSDDAITLWRHILPLRERVTGKSSLDTLRVRHNLLYWEAETAYPPPVISEFHSLVQDLASTFGDTHPETITARYHHALFMAKSMRPDDIRQAFVLWQEMLPDAERTFGVHHEQTKQVREQLGYWPKQL